MWDLGVWNTENETATPSRSECLFRREERALWKLAIVGAKSHIRRAAIRSHVDGLEIAWTAKMANGAINITITERFWREANR